jgi:hypothetical protein
MLHLSFAIPLHKSFAVALVASSVIGDVGDITGFTETPPKKNHALKRIIAAGINILRIRLFTILYWKLRADDIFAILLYIISNILFS